MTTTLFDMTLDEAKSWLRERVDEGATCPCCGQFAKIYKRRINAGMARALIVMHRKAGTDWIHKPTALSGLGAAARDESLCRYWGLTEQDEGLRDDGSNRNGWWRVTDSGRLFVLNQKTVPKYARIYDGRCLGFEGEPVSIVDALGKKFDYRALMNGTA